MQLGHLFFTLHKTSKEKKWSSNRGTVFQRVHGLERLHSHGSLFEWTVRALFKFRNELTPEMLN